MYYNGSYWQSEFQKKSKSKTKDNETAQVKTFQKPYTDVVNTSLRSNEHLSDVYFDLLKGEEKKPLPLKLLRLSTNVN